MRRIVDNQRVPTVEGRERRWSVVFPRDDEAIVINYLVLGPGEEIHDSPPEERMSLDEWKLRHAEFGLTVDGRPL